MTRIKPPNPMNTIVQFHEMAKATSREKIYTAEEVDRMKEQAQSILMSGNMLVLNLRAMHTEEPLKGRELSKQIAALEKALDEVLWAAFRIGAATIAHPAIQRHFQSLSTSKAREGRTQHSDARKKEAVKKNILPGLVDKGLTRSELHAAINAALATEGVKNQVSIETTARWVRDHLKSPAK